MTGLGFSGFSTGRGGTKKKKKKGLSLTTTRWGKIGIERVHTYRSTVIGGKKTKPSNGAFFPEKKKRTISRSAKRGNWVSAKKGKVKGGEGRGG